MNPLDVMKYGHLTILGSVDGFTDEEWEEGNVCGVWSSRDIIAHLASYELLLEDVLSSFAGDEPTPRLSHYLTTGMAFNDIEVDARKGQSVADTLGEYTGAYSSVAAIALEVSETAWRTVGSLPWYGAEYSLEDWIVYQFYGHKREHAAQIHVYRDRIGR